MAIGGPPKHTCHSVRRFLADGLMVCQSRTRLSLKLTKLRLIPERAVWLEQTDSSTRQSFFLFFEKVTKLIADYSITLTRSSFKFASVEDRNLTAAISNDALSLQVPGSLRYSRPGNAQDI